ncbi:MAG: FG-GAP repeat domain-containing protein [Pyrinomonadaceae bacterium]
MRSKARPAWRCGRRASSPADRLRTPGRAATPRASSRPSSSPPGKEARRTCSSLSKAACVCSKANRVASCGARACGRASGGCVAALEGEAGGQALAVATDDPNQLYFLDTARGAVVSRAPLDGAVIGVPIPFANGAERGVVLSLTSSQLDVRRSGGERLRAVKFDVPFVTPPLVVASPRGTLVAVGTEHGLLFLNGDLKPLGRIATEGEAPRGRLGAADLNGDGLIEIVMLTSTGRVAVVNAEGKINWSARGARGAYTPVFADLDRDGYLDVITADAGTFARAFSGRDGTIIWQADDAATNATDESGALRNVAIGVDEAGANLIVSGDRARGALRASGLPAGAPRQ